MYNVFKLFPILFQRGKYVSDEMATLSLRISIVEKNVTKTMQFDPNTSVYDACRIIRDKITEANLGQREYTPNLDIHLSWIYT